MSAVCPSIIIETLVVCQCHFHSQILPMTSTTFAVPLDFHMLSSGFLQSRVSQSISSSQSCTLPTVMDRQLLVLYFVIRFFRVVATGKPRTSTAYH